MPQEHKLLSDSERFDYARLKKLELEGIETYRKFKESEPGSPERLAAFINQLSPWNLHRGADAIRDYANMVIGEDEPHRDVNVSGLPAYKRNQLRAEQRERNK